MSAEAQAQAALELHALQRVIASGARALELDVVLDRCLEQAMAVARADAGTLYLRDPRRSNYRLAASRNTGPDFPAPPLTVEDRPAADGSFFDHVVVLSVDTRRVGFLRLLFKAKPALAESTLNTLEAIAAFEAIALEKARVHQQAELRARVAHALNDCAERLLDPDADVPALVLDFACRLGRGHGALFSTIFVRDGAEYARIEHAVGNDKPLIGMVLPTSAPYLREAMAQHAPMVIEDVDSLDANSIVGRVARDQGTRAFILVTMRQAGRAVGQLFVKSNEPRVYAEAEIDAIQLLATMAAQALTRERRQAAERAEHARVAAILEHLPVAVAVIDKAGTIIHINEAARQFAARMGSDDPDWRAGMSRLTVLDKDGQPIPFAEQPLVRAFGGVTTAREVTIVSASGDRVHLQAIGVPLRAGAPDAAPDAVMTAFHDVTELRELADAKDRFLSIASHELRSPITSLRATTSLLQLDPNALADESRRTTLLARIQRQLDRLSMLVERLLDTTRLNAGELPLDYADADLTALCNDAVEHARLTDPEHSYALDAPEPIFGRFDPARVEQVLTNLLSNACRYSPARSPIVVRLRALDRDHAAIDVVDQGPGVALDQQDKLFKPFYRGAAASRHKGGLGLGLYITSEIVRRHGGRIRVQSTPGQGATFTVELPLGPTK